MKKTKSLLLVALFIFTSMLLSCSVFAATKLVELKEAGKEYRSYDFNGDR